MVISERGQEQELDDFAIDPEIQEFCGKFCIDCNKDVKLMIKIAEEDATNMGMSIGEFIGFLDTVMTNTDLAPYLSQEQFEDELRRVA